MVAEATSKRILVARATPPASCRVGDFLLQNLVGKMEESVGKNINMLGKHGGNMHKRIKRLPQMMVVWCLGPLGLQICSTSKKTQLSLGEAVSWQSYVDGCLGMKAMT